MKKRLIVLRMMVIIVILSVFAYINESENTDLVLSANGELHEEFDRLHPYEHDGLWGFMDSSSNIIIQPQYYSVNEFSEGLAFVSGVKGMEYMTGFIDLEGNLVIPLPLYTNVHIYEFGFSEGFVSVILREWDDDEIIFTPPQNPYEFEYHALIGPRVFVDRTGQNIFGFEFYGAASFSEGLAFVTGINGDFEQTGYIDLTGNLVIPLPEALSASQFSEGFAHVIVREWDRDIEAPAISGTPGPYIFIDKTGQNIFNQEFITVDSFRNGFARVYLINANVALIDRTGANAFGMEFLYIYGDFDEDEHVRVMLLDRTMANIDVSGNIFGTNPGTVTVPATRTYETIRLTIGSTTATGNVQIVGIGSATTFDDFTEELDFAPYIDENGRTMVPLRFIAYVMRVPIYWDAATQTVTITHRSRGTIHLIAGQALPDGMGMPEIVDGRIFVPVRFITEVMGGTIDWDSDTQTVTIII